MAWFDDPAHYYGPGAETLAQGDIVVTASGVFHEASGPAVALAPPFGQAQDVALWEAAGGLLPDAPALSITVTWGLAMVLPHVCALEKEFNERVAELTHGGLTQEEAERQANDDPSLDRFIAVAPLLLYDQLAPRRREGVRSGQRLGAFPVVAHAGTGIPEAWVDLTRLSTVERALVEVPGLPHRLAALSDLAVAHLQFALARHWAFRDLSRLDEISRAVGRRIQSVTAVAAPKGRLAIGLILDGGDQLTLEGSARPEPPSDAPRRKARGAAT